MTTPPAPCASCGGPVTLVTVEDERHGGSSAVVQRRTCENAACPTNRPPEQRLFTDTV